MIKLSNRLDRIAGYIDEYDTVIDVGCDHALLDIYLSNKYNKRYYASDLRKSALENAKKNISKYNASNVILKCGFGMDTIDNEEIDTVVISGMGYNTILRILKNKKKLKQIKKLIIESNNNPQIIRKYLVKNGFYIYDEDIVLDNNKYYVITCYKLGNKKYSNYELEVGMLKNNEVISKYLELEIKKNKILLSIIPFKYILKKYNIKRLLRYLNKKKDSIK